MRARDGVRTSADRARPGAEKGSGAGTAMGRRRARLRRPRPIDGLRGRFGMTLGLDQRLAGRAAIVTGAARGIGLACARRLASDGARVTLADVDADEGGKAAASIAGGTFVRADVSIKEDVEALVARVVADAGRIDILVSNAGITHACGFLDLAEEDFDRVLRVNLKS